MSQSGSLSTGGGGSGIVTIDADTGSVTGTTVGISGDSTGLTTSGSGATISLGGTLNVASGGTGDNSVTAYAPVCGGTTSTSPLQSASTGFSNANYVLTSNGSSALPSWKPVASDGAVIQLTTSDLSIVTPTAGNINLSQGTGLTTTGSGSTATIALSVPVTVAHGGTGQTAYTNGQLLIGNTTTTGLTPATLTAGSNVTITNGPGSISIAATNPGVGTLTGDSGSATGSSIALHATNHLGGSPSFTASSSTVLLNASDVNNNTTFGANSGASFSSSTGDENTGCGVYSLYSGTTGSDNSAYGFNSLLNVATGNNNTAYGADTLNYIVSGSDNIALGYEAGISLGSANSSNILIGNSGSPSDNNLIRIGRQGSGTGQQNKCFIAGITGVTTTNTNMVTINTATGQLGAATVPSPGSVTLSGDSGSSITGASLNVITNLASDNCGSSVSFDGDGLQTLTLSVSDPINNTFIGRNSGNPSVSGVNQVALGVEALAGITTGTENTAIGTASLYAISTGNYNIALGIQSGMDLASSESSNIDIGHTGVIGDNHTIRIGTHGNSAGQQNRCFIGGINGVTTSNSNMVTINTTTGQLGAAALPGYVTLSGDTGSATGSTITLNTGNSTQNCGSSVLFGASGSVMTLQVTDVGYNTIIGHGAGKAVITGIENSSYGTNSMKAVTTGGYNCAYGASSLNALTSGNYNTGIGSRSLLSLTSASNNVAVGYEVLTGIDTGTTNLAIGFQAGDNYTSSESSNILVGSLGTTGDSNTIRIGMQGSSTGQQNACYIAGIYGSTIAGGSTVLCGGDGSLGTIASSIRYKENVTSVSKESDQIHELRPVKFTYRNDKSGEAHYGLIAEEVEEIMPELVVYDKEGRPDSVKYHELPALLLNEIQKLRCEIDVLKSKISKMAV